MTPKPPRSRDTITVPSLIRSLGFCCPYLFFHLFKSTGMIAARLGCSRQSAMRWKARSRAKLLTCENADGCLKCKEKDLLLVMRDRRSESRGKED